MSQNLKLQMVGISKHFGRIQANKNVNLDLYEGEILSILGENGSGKTTLMNMISGIYYPDEGSIFINGEEVTIASPRDAYKYKIGMIHQHFKLVDVFSASENIILGINDEKKKLDIKEVNSAVAEIANRYGFNIDPTKKVHEMSVSEKQTVEIIKVLYRGADILILDEPTAVLTPQEIKKLFKILNAMKADGKSIIIITHKLNEVMEISDRITVLRKGEYIGSVLKTETNEKELTEMMVGKKVDLDIERKEPVNPVDRLIVKNLSCKNHENVKTLDNVSFVARSGEILGIAGIAGSGQKVLLESIVGLQKIEKGEVIFNNPKKDQPVTYIHKSYEKVLELAKAGAFHYEDGTKVDFTGLSKKEIVKLVNDGKILFNEDEVINLRDKNPLEIRELGVRLSFVPEDRLGMGLVGNMNIIDNMMLRSYRKGKSFLVDRKNPAELAEEIVEDLEVVTPGIKTPVSRLSGGNIQKILVGREIAFAPKVFMAAYPVRGLDINSSYLIYHLLNKQKERGAAVIYVGEDLDVLLALCDRIIVMNNGQITGTVDAKSVTKEEIGLLMTKTL